MNGTLPRAATIGLCALVLALVLARAARAQTAARTGAGGDPLESMARDGLRRTWLVHVPPGPDSSKVLPLVIVLHGGGGTGASVAKLTGFDRLADSAGFVVAYPNAVNGHWNDGRQVRRFRAQRDNVDDVGFIRSLADRLVRERHLDPERVYVTGMSNGGMMCHRIGCELADRVAAIAPVAAALPVPLASAEPARPVSVLAVNGTADPLVPYEGGGVGLVAKRGAVVSVARTVEFWTKADGCAARPGPATTYDTDPGDSLSVRCETWGGGRDSTEVVLYTVEGGGHTWPGGAERPQRYGRRASDIDATRVIWEFFSRHRRT